MDYEDMIKEFTISIYGEIEKYNDVLSKTRARIYYKYFNRNGTYISDEFAEKLNETLPYTPIKGIYNELVEDYGEHGRENSEGKIYGIVPETFNFSWEKFKDEDGIEREYACTDVLLFTGIYDEAKEILGKSLSMELYKPTLKGEFKFVEGKRVFYMKEGCFVGLQILGDGVEPCFEGAGFYTFKDSLEKTMKALERIEEKYSLEEEGGRSNMIKVTYKLSHGDIRTQLFNLLNAKFNEENNWEVTCGLNEVFDDYAVVYHYDTEKYERVYYSKNEKDEVVLGERVECFILDVTASEKASLETIQALNNGNYEKLEETMMPKSEFELKIAEKETEFSTLNLEKENILAEKETLAEELNTFKEYKLGKELEEKEKILDKYSVNLEETVVNTYKEKLSDYSILDLEKDLAFELVNSNPNLFSLNSNSGLIPTEDEQPKNGLEAALDHYKNKMEEK